MAAMRATEDGRSSLLKWVARRDRSVYSAAVHQNACCEGLPPPRSGPQTKPLPLQRALFSSSQLRPAHTGRHSACENGKPAPAKGTTAIRSVRSSLETFECSLLARTTPRLTRNL